MAHTLQLYPTHSTHRRLRPEEQRRPSSRSASHSSHKELGTRTEEWNPPGITEEASAESWRTKGKTDARCRTDEEHMGKLRDKIETGGCQPYKTAPMEEPFQFFATQHILEICQKAATHLQLFKEDNRLLPLQITLQRTKTYASKARIPKYGHYSTYSYPKGSAGSIFQPIPCHMTWSISHFVAET